jgi:hypothetical protein
MDGAMPKTVLISLAAVVALIVIVILLGMRYLRADDEDDFDDDVPAEHGRYPHDPARPRHEHDEMPQDRLRQRPRATPSGRAPAARPAGRAPSRVADDRSWREESSHAAGRGSLPQRHSHSARSGGRRDRDDISEPAVANARRGYQGQDRADTREADRDLLQSRDGRDRREARTVAGSREIAVTDRDDRDRRSVSRPSQRPDGGRRNGAASDQDELLPAIKPRQGRNKREADGDWPSNEWDELSDVDYWAELAADKPLTTPTPADQAGGPRRGGSRSDVSEPAVRDRDAGRAGRQARQRDAAVEPERAIVSTAARKLDPAPADRGEDLLGSGTRRASLGRTEQPHGLPPSPGMGRDGFQPRNPEPADDDPLTSPSFPRIAADDSRSYRRAKRSAAEESDPRGLTRDSSTQPHSYSPPAGPPGDNGTAYQGAGPSGSYMSPEADPYASVPRGNSVPGYPVPGGYVLPGGPAAGSYPGGGSGYTGSADVGQNGYRSAGSASADSYLPPPAAAASGGYPGEVVGGSYQPPPPDHASFRPPGDSGSYQSPPGSYPDAGLGGHLPAATTAGYPIAGDATEYRANQADFGGAYPSYGDHRPSVVPQPPTDPGYLPDGYSTGYEPGLHPSPPGRLEPGYPVYQAPVAPTNGGPYPPGGGGQLPGPSAGYQDPYLPATYDHAGYPSPAPQRGYAGADPYAADPYGYSGYGSGGR